MKKRWRIKSRQSPDPASADRSGQQASAAAAADGKGGDEGKQQQRSGGGERSPSPGEEIAARSKRRRKKEKRRLSDPLPVRRGIPCGVLDDALFGEETAVAPEGREETSASLKVEKKKPSGDLGKIAQDEDEHSDKKPSSRHLGKMVAQDEDEQLSDMIGVPAIEDHKQEQGGAGGCVQALLDLDDETISEKISHCFKQFKFGAPEDDCHYWPEYEPHQLTEVNERLALYRIRAYQLSVDRQLAGLDDETLKNHYSPPVLYDKGYFKYYEESLEWYFDPELCMRPEFDDYQRIVLRDNWEYEDWNQYHLIDNTYEKDLAYVRYCAALANETKWVEDCLAHNTHQWKKIKNVALLQALKVAAGFRDVSLGLIISGFKEHLWSIQFDHFNYKGLDGVYFEIWKRVAKLKMNFRDALLELHDQDMFPLRSFDIKHELENTRYRRFSLKDKYDAHVAWIDDMVSEDKARQLILEAVIKMVPKPKIYLDYAKKKLDIAKDIWLIRKVED